MVCANFLIETTYFWSNFVYFFLKLTHFAPFVGNFDFFAFGGGNLGYLAVKTVVTVVTIVTGVMVVTVLTVPHCSCPLLPTLSDADGVMAGGEAGVRRGGAVLEELLDLRGNWRLGTSDVPPTQSCYID